MRNSRVTIRFSFFIWLNVVFFLDFGLFMAFYQLILPEIIVHSPQNQAWAFALSCFVAGCLMVVGIVIVLQRIVMRPLAALVSHVRMVRALESFWDRLRFRSHDELGFLALSFNRLLHHIQLKTTELTRVNTELETLAKTDRLTGLANRRMFEDQMSKELRRMIREKRGSTNKGKITLVICDVDFFKQFNDHYGHVAGDACLAAIGGQMQGCLKRAGDLACRFGGEEFIFMLPDCDLMGGMKVAEHIRMSVIELGLPHVVSSAAPVVSVSVGVATTEVNEQIDTNKLLEAADRALYKAKAAGRNRVVCSD